MSPRRPPIIIDNDIEASGFGSGSDPIGVGVVRHDGCLVFDVASRLNELQRGRLGYGDNWVPGRPRLARLQAAVSMRGDFTFSMQEMMLPEPHAAAWTDTRQALLARKPETRHRARHDARVVRGTFEGRRGTLTTQTAHQ